MKVLSLCDGMSCGQIALKEIGVDVEKYYASEIEKNAIKVTQENFPKTIQLGDVIALSENYELLKSLEKIDIVMFGFPCRSLSNATAGTKYNNGLKGVSGIFYNCLKILNWIKENNNKDVKFLVENVNSNQKKDIEIITELLGVDPILINSNLFSAQDRERLYWTNIKVDELPKKCDLILEDILEEQVDKKYYYNRSFEFYGLEKRVCAKLNFGRYETINRVYNKRYKSATLTSCRGGHHQIKLYDEEENQCRKLTPTEYRRLQTIPDWYKMNISDGQIYNICGDGWTIEVIKHILKGLK